MEELVFFGSSFDCDDHFESIEEKIAYIKGARGGVSPYKGVVKRLMEEFSVPSSNFLGEVEVESWISCFPEKDEISLITSKNFVEFMERGGCLKEAKRVKEFVFERVLPRPFCFVGIDHSLSGGTIEAVTDFYGSESVSVIVLDAHTDAIPLTVTIGAIHYDMEHNKDSFYSKDDELLFNRKDSYNASSFFHYLILEGKVKPENLFLLGIGDFPPKEAFKIKDKRIVSYTQSFLRLKRMGVKLFTKKEVEMDFRKVDRVLKRIKTPYIYISVDMDVGALESVEAVRFKNRKGLREKEIFKLIKVLNGVLKDAKKKLIGIDFMEFNPREGKKSMEAYEFAVKILKKLFKEV